MKPFKSQGGFSAVELVLIVVVIGLLGAIGWLVLGRTKQTPISTATVKTAQTQPKKVAATTDATPQDSTQYYKVEKWGIRIPLTTDIANLYAKENPTLGFTSFRTTSLDKLSGAKCRDNGIDIVRGTADQKMATEGPNDGNGPTYAETYASYSSGKAYHVVYVKIGQYYYLTPLVSGTTCNMTAPDQQKEIIIMNSITAAVNKMVAL